MILFVTVVIVVVVVLIVIVVVAVVIIIIFIVVIVVIVNAFSALYSLLFFFFFFFSFSFSFCFCFCFFSPAKRRHKITHFIINNRRELFQDIDITENKHISLLEYCITKYKSVVKDCGWARVGCCINGESADEYE